MKLLSLLLLLSCGQVVAQKKSPVKGFQWPKPVKDSAWIEVRSDTMHGTIEYNFGGGTVTGDGMLVKDQFFHWQTSIYSDKDQRKIDSFRNAKSAEGIFYGTTDGGYSTSTEDQKRAYIKTSNGWKFVQEQFTFRPK